MKNFIETFTIVLTIHSSTLISDISGPDPGLLKEAVDLIAVIYSITDFLFANKIIEPRLLEKMKFESPEFPI